MMQYRQRQASLNVAGTPINPNALATIRTVDSAQAAEWDVVLLDLTISNADRVQDVGHMYDDHRACVALTRARKVLWIVSGFVRGKLTETSRDDSKSGNSPFKPQANKALCAILAIRKELYRSNQISTAKVNLVR